MTIGDLSAVNSYHLTKLRQFSQLLLNLNVTGDAATSSPYIKTQTNAVSVTSDVLTTLTVGGTLDRVSLHGATKLTSLSTVVIIRDFEIIGASILEAATIGHDHIEGSDAASLRISGASKLTGLTPTALDEVGTCNTYRST